MRAAARANLSCVECHKSLAHLGRSDARYCGNECQQIAYRRRKATASGFICKAVD
jgi:hypothetical protein